MSNMLIDVEHRNLLIARVQEGSLPPGAVLRAGRMLAPERTLEAQLLPESHPLLPRGYVLLTELSVVQKQVLLTWGGLWRLAGVDATLQGVHTGQVWAAHVLVALTQLHDSGSAHEGHTVTLQRSDRWGVGWEVRTRMRGENLTIHASEARQGGYTLTRIPRVRETGGREEESHKYTFDTITDLLTFTEQLSASHGFLNGQTQVSEVDLSREPQRTRVEAALDLFGYTLGDAAVGARGWSLNFSLAAQDKFDGFCGVLTFEETRQDTFHLKWQPCTPEEHDEAHGQQGNRTFNKLDEMLRFVPELHEDLSRLARAAARAAQHRTRKKT